MTVPFVDASLWTAASGGSGSFVVNGAITSFMTPAAAGAVNAQPLHYRAQNGSNQWEIGKGVWTTSTSTLTRAIILFNSDGTGLSQGGLGLPVNFSTAPQVGIVLLAEDVPAPGGAGGDFQINDGSGGFAGLSAVNTTAQLSLFTSIARGLVPPSGGAPMTFLRSDGSFATPREVVISNRTYYVNKNTGNDAHDGLTIGTAFKTPQKAIDVITQTLYIFHCDIIIQLLGGGVWDDGLLLGAYVGTTNEVDFSGPVIKGTAGNRTDITLAPTTGVDFFGNVVCCQNSKWTIQDITLDAVNVANFDWAIVSVTNGNLTIINPSFGQAPPNAGYYVLAFESIVSVECIPPNTNSHINIGGGSSNLNTVFYVADSNSRIFDSNNDWVLDGAPAFDAFASVIQHSAVAFHNSSFTGAATGRRFEMRSGSRITITGADVSLTALPGNAPGTWDDSTCWYNNICVGPLVLGQANTTTGEIDFVGKTSGTTKLSVPDAAFNGTIKLPASTPSAGYFVKTDASGNQDYGTDPPARLFANLPGSPTVGMLFNITDSNTVVWGAAIAGLGANNVLARWNGAAWTVVGK